jgi:dihydropteroate synthase
MRPKNTLFPVARFLQSRGRLLSLDRPQVMGILNLTPDSFFAGSRMSGEKQLLQTAEAMLRAGATLLDVGGASTRPGAQLPASLTELKRILPAIEALHTHFPDAWISVDTVHASVAEAAIEAGAAIVNDISGGQLDPQMHPTVARLQVPYIAMHMQGTPETMQQAPQYENVVLEVFYQLKEQLQSARRTGIRDVILDVGFGFGKTLAHNYALLREMDAFRALGCPLLAGVSRKGMIWKALDTTAKQALNGTTAVHMLALQNGASILRVHDVPEAIEAVKIWEHYESAAA